MINIKRTYTPKELSKTNREFKAAIKDMSTKQAYDFYKANENKFCYNTVETKRLFRKMNHERCSFCTRLIQEFNKEMTVEHIKIKRDYPQKIFQWSNLLCACKTCNTQRGTRKYDARKYMDPTKIKDIEKYFWYKADGEIAVCANLDEDEKKKADYMINLYSLNREELVCKRREFIRDLMSDDDFYEILKKKDESSQNIIFLSVFAYYKKQEVASYN